MLKLNKKVEYAIIILNHFDKTGKLVTVKEISSFYKISYDLVSKIMQILNKADILSSKQGSKGGYELQRDLGSLSIYELQEMILGKRYMVDCFFSGKTCETLENCSITRPVRKLNQKVDNFFKELTVKEFLAF